MQLLDYVRVSIDYVHVSTRTMWVDWFCNGNSNVQHREGGK